MLNSFALYRCSLITTEGVLVEEDASVSSSAAAGLWEGGNDSSGDFVEYNPITGTKCGPASNVDDSTIDRVVRSSDEHVPLYILYTSGSTGKHYSLLLPFYVQQNPTVQFCALWFISLSSLPYCFFPGKPKGVLGTYKGLLNRIAWQMDTYPWEFGESVTHFMLL